MIDLVPSAEQLQIVDSVSSFLAKEAPLARLRSGKGGSGELDIWQKIAALGCFSLSIPESAGGVGYSLSEEALVFREFGRFLVSPCALATALATRLAVSNGLRDVAAELIAGTSRAGFAVPPAPAEGTPRAGGACYFLDCVGADLIVVMNGRETALYERESFSECRELESFDESLSLQSATLESSSLCAAEDSSAFVRQAQVLNAAMMVGIAEAARDMASSYAKERQQFGKPIGTFQAIKHSCADAAVRSEGALCQTLYASLAVRDKRPDAAYQTAAAVLLSAEAAMRNSTSNIQVHGGLGFTEECHAHRFLKRSNVLVRLAGGVRFNQRSLMAEEFPSY